LWYLQIQQYKISKYKEKNNKSFKHVKDGIKEINELFAPYNYNVILLAYKGFKSVDLFKFIDKIG
jgi:hypothetical protein